MGLNIIASRSHHLPIKFNENLKIGSKVIGGHTATHTYKQTYRIMSAEWV
jgi:hypothetical protein